MKYAKNGDVVMISENIEVCHKAFGKGTVVANQGKYITVKFASTQKIFVYPDAFETFLTLADGTVSDEIKTDIAAAKQAKQVIIDKKNEENLRAMTRGIVIPGKDMSNIESEDEEHRYKRSEQEEI